VTRTKAIVFEAPQALLVRTMPLEAREAAYIVEAVTGGIGARTECLPSGGTMPRFPGLGDPKCSPILMTSSA